MKTLDARYSTEERREEHGSSIYHFLSQKPKRNKNRITWD
jgi:hypothetical protein